MTIVRNSAVAGVAAILAVGGAFWTQHRETNSACSDTFFTSQVHEEMRQQFLDESQFLSALEAAADPANVYVEGADKERYARAADELKAAVAAAEITGRMKHPNGPDLQTCHLSLSFSDVLSESDLIGKTAPGFVSGPDFSVVARFEIKFKDVAGVQFAETYEAQRNQWLVGRIEDANIIDVQVSRGRLVDTEVASGGLVPGGIAAGTVVEAARTATVGRRDMVIEEPEFPDLDFSMTYVPEADIEDGFYGKK